MLIRCFVPCNLLLHIHLPLYLHLHPMLHPTWGRRSARTLARRVGVNWGGVSLADMTSLLASDDLDWSADSEATKLANKWRDALLKVNEDGAGLVVTKDNKQKGPLLSDTTKFAGTGPQLPSSSRRLLSMTISQHRGATHMPKSVQEALLQKVLAVEAASQAAQARQVPTEADYVPDDLGD